MIARQSDGMAHCPLPRDGCYHNSRRPPPPPPTKTKATCLPVALPESSTLKPSRSPRPWVASWLAPHHWQFALSLVVQNLQWQLSKRESEGLAHVLPPRPAPCGPHLPPPWGSSASQTSACKDGNTIERMSAQGAASARCEPLPRVRST
jgi:hypothetical protein